MLLPRLLLLASPLILAACAQNDGGFASPLSAPPSASASVPATAAEAPEPPPVGLANPASVYCESEDVGGFLTIRTDEEGGESGVCLLPDGTEIDEWELFRRDNPQ